MTEPPSGPAFTGLVVHRDAQFDYVVLVPDGWQRLDLSGSDGGAFFAPDPADGLTGLAIDALDLGTDVAAADLAVLRTGMLAGIRRLPGCHLESHEAEVVGQLLTLEARYTFRDADAIRKRWVRLLYQARTQLRVVAQASSVDAFAYWEPMFFTAMRTVRFGAMFSA
jgi:hypothetical protein